MFTNTIIEFDQEEYNKVQAGFKILCQLENLMLGRGIERLALHGICVTLEQLITVNQTLDNVLTIMD